MTWLTHSFPRFYIVFINFWTCSPEYCCILISNNQSINNYFYWIWKYKIVWFLFLNIKRKKNPNMRCVFISNNRYNWHNSLSLSTCLSNQWYIIKLKKKEIHKIFSFLICYYFSGEAKNLITNSVSGTGKNTFCIIRLDREEIYRTTVVNRSLKYVFYDIIILSKTCFYHCEQKVKLLPLWTKH